jgi:hypothetical protein
MNKINQFNSLRAVLSLRQLFLETLIIPLSSIPENGSVIRIAEKARHARCLAFSYSGKLLCRSKLVVS